MLVRTFSGTRDWQPSVLADTDAIEALNADGIIEDIESGRCPRCWGPLPTPPDFPTGSRITNCRSIPICGRCGNDEVHEALDGLGISSAGSWPLPEEEIEERRERYRHLQTTFAILTGDGQLITEDGSTRVINPCNTGGWLQYGNPEEEGPSD
jgi:hypothetical protein